MEKKCNPILKGVRKVNDGAVVILFATMTITVIIQVFFRFVLQSPLRWTEELARYTMIWLVLLAAAIASRNRSHLQVDILTAGLPKKAKLVLNILVDVLTILFLGIMTWFGIQVVMTTLTQVSPAMQIPMAAIYAAFPTGGALMIMEQVIVLIERIRDRNEPEPPRELLD